MHITLKDICISYRHVIEDLLDIFPQYNFSFLNLLTEGQQATGIVGVFVQKLLCWIDSFNVNILVMLS